MGWGGVGRGGMGWGGMGWDEMGRDWMGWDGVGRVGVGWMGWDGVGRVGVGWMEWDGIGCGGAGMTWRSSVTPITMNTVPNTMLITCQNWQTLRTARTSVGVRDMRPMEAESAIGVKSHNGPRPEPLAPRKPENLIAMYMIELAKPTNEMVRRKQVTLI